MADVEGEEALGGEENEGSMAGPPVAPVPPAPPPPLSDTLLRGTSTHPAGDVCAALSMRISTADGSTSPRGKAQELQTLKDEFRRVIRSESLELGENCALLSRHKILTSILQDGPMCGLVALAMCSNMVKKEIVSSDTLFDYARVKGLTLHGEMFSAATLAEIAEKVVKCTSRVLDLNSEDAVRTLVGHLVRGNPVVFPYDADANHAPCLKKGHKAHWAAISGILIIHNSSMSEDLRSVLQEDTGFTGLYHIPPADDFCKDQDQQDMSTYKKVLKDIIDYGSGRPDLIYLYSKQGKSKFTRLYSLQKFIESNKNLTEIDPKIVQNIQDFVVPEGGISNICGKVVLLEKA